MHPSLAMHPSSRPGDFERVPSDALVCYLRGYAPLVNWDDHVYARLDAMLRWREAERVDHALTDEGWVQPEAAKLFAQVLPCGPIGFDGLGHPVVLETPDALYPGERYCVETVAMPSLGVPHASLEFVMPERDERLALELERPKGNVNLVLVDAKARSGHWAAGLPLPAQATIRVKHHALGIVLPEQKILASASANGGALLDSDVASVFHRFDKDRSGDIDASELRDALEALGLSTSSEQAVRVMHKYDKDRSGKLEFDEFLRLVTELRSFQGTAAVAPVALAGASATGGASSSSKSSAVLSFALRNALFVGETYTLEVLETAELEGASIEFFVEYVDRQSVEVAVKRKSRPMMVVLKYLQDDVESFPLDVRSEHVSVIARHKALGKVTTSGATKQGAADLMGDDALYVGMTYVLELEGTMRVSSKPTEVTISPGKAPLVCELPVGPKSGTVHVHFRNALADSGYPLEGLALPPVSFVIFPIPRTGREKVSGTTDSKGRATLSAGSQLYVGRSYTLEVGREANQHVLEPVATEFKVHAGEQSVKLDVRRAVGDVRAIFQTEHANGTHWAAPLKLPAPFEFRVLHRGLNAEAYSSEVPRQPSHTVRQALPGKHTLFVGEQYTLEVGYQVKAVLKQCSAQIASLMAAGTVVTFNGAGEGGLPSIEQAWSVEYHGDRAIASRNHAALDAIASLMRQYPMLTMDVRSETGAADWASKALAGHYKLDRT